MPKACTKAEPLIVPIPVRSAQFERDATRMKKQGQACAMGAVLELEIDSAGCGPEPQRPRIMILTPQPHGPSPQP